ncbi:MAG: helix-turn-helix transcriptional regulator [candidate division WOR-3 bacterium]|jgi:transcriptional regulator with XRE-family HTH domain
MAAKKKAKLRGLAELGSKLRELRLNAGISQMKLAEIIGLNPTHGYKYILRLEKGLVPNPTLRTITGYLKACNASWQDIADVLSVIDLTEIPHPEPEKNTQPVIIARYHPELTPTATIDGSTRALTNQVQISTERFWQLVQHALDRAWSELRTSTLSPGNRRALFTFIRSTCLLLNSSQPQNLNSQLERLLNLTAAQGLDKNLLVRVQNICLETFARAAGE